MKNTTNYSLLLPEETDFYSVKDFNDNMETIDTQMKSNQAKADTVTSNHNIHVSNKSNPHGVTKAQVGLSNVPNVTTNDQTPTYAEPSSLGALVSGEKLSVAFGKLAKAIASLISHLADKVSHITSAERSLWNSKADGVLLHSRIPQYFNVKSQAELDAVMNEHSTSLAINTYYNFTLSVAVSGLSLMGGTYYVEGMKTSADYEWQRMTKYPNGNTLPPLLIMGRSKFAGTWGAWENIAMQSEILGLQSTLGTKVDKVTGKVLSTNDYTTAEKTKLAGIATGAQVNTIIGIKGNAETTYRTGQVNITPANIGLGNVNNTADSAKNVLSATKLTTPRTIALSGDVTGSVSFDGSGNATMTTTVVDSSHNHNISNVSGLQVALDDKVTKGMFANGRMRLIWVDSSSQLHLIIDDTVVGKFTITSV